MPPENRTCVANATHKTILARVRKEPLSEKITIKVVTKDGTTVEISKETLQNMATQGFTQVHSRNWTGFQPGGNKWLRNGQVYVSVYSMGGQLIAEDHPVHDNYSVLVVTNSEGKDELKISEQGDVWTDESGRCYKNW